MRELMTRLFYAENDIVVKFRSQTLLHILGMISLYVKMKMEKERYWESIEKRRKSDITHQSIHTVPQLRVKAQAPCLLRFSVAEG